MGLFERKRFVWNEPWFFQQRIRTATEWLRIALFLLLAAAAIFAIFFWAAPAGGPLDWLRNLGISLAAPLVLWVYMDGVIARRQAALWDDKLIVNTDNGRFSSSDSYKLLEIAGARIVLPEESEWPSAVLFFFYQNEPHAIGIEREVNLKRMAKALHQAGVEVDLDGWHPDHESAIEKEFRWQADPESVLDRASLDPLPPGTPGLFSVDAMVLSLFYQLTALVLALAAIVGSVYYCYQNWNILDPVNLMVAIVVSIGSLYVAGYITDRFGLAAGSKVLVRSAKRQILKRDGLEIDPGANEMVPVAIIARNQFGKTIMKIREQGFLQADTVGQRMLFEGKKERWCIPLHAIRSVAIEEVHTGTPGQSTTGQMNYFVIVKFDADEDQEFGFRYDDREYGKHNEITRAQGAIRLYEVFESALTHAETTSTSIR